MTNEERPHVEALALAVSSKFKDVSPPNSEIMLLLRQRLSVVEEIQVTHMTSAMAARWRAVDYYDEKNVADPLWYESGTVADVITALLDLPDDGEPGAPTRALVAPSDLIPVVAKPKLWPGRSPRLPSLSW
ncbi:hypothetical protein [Amycolatopsis sp. NPDC003861]